MKNQLAILILFVSTTLFSQNTLTLDGAESPKATLNDVAWIAGHWKGEAFGGITEEIWTPPLGNSMMGAFKLLENGTVSFYEIETISEENGTLILRLKHFHSNLKGWEEKDETIDFPLVKIEKDKVYFEGMTFERISANEMNIYVVIGEDETTGDEYKFNYKLVE
jgi:hypothetical protein